MTGIDVSTGFLAGIRGRAARKLEQRFLPHLQTLLASAPVLHADETAGITEPPEKLLADAGYASEANFAQLDDQGPDAYIATRNTHKNPTPRTGKRGPLRADATLVDKMDRKVSTKTGQTLDKRRQAIIEPVFGQIKEARGIRRFMRRGRAAAESEWQPITGTHNLLKLYRRALANPTIAPYSHLATS